MLSSRSSSRAFFVRVGVCAMFAGAVVSARDSFADDAVTQARESYDRGAAAYDAKDYATACGELARADELAPNDSVLDLALKAAVRAQNAPLVMELVTRAETRVVPTSPIWARAHEARGKFEANAARIVVRCPPPAEFCEATIDGKNQEIDAIRWTTVGTHEVAFKADGVAEKITAHVVAGQLNEVKPTPPAPKTTPSASAKPPPPPPPSSSSPAPLPPPSPPPVVDHPRHGLSPVWVWIGAGATAVAGGLLIASAIDTESKHDAFEKNPSTDLQSQGRTATDRTNVLVAVTGGLGLATGVLAGFFVSWSSGPQVTITGKF